VQIGQDMRIQTAYFGSLKTRKRLFRAYDKGLEQGHVANFVVRYELETRQNATQLAKAVAEGKDIGALINNYISVIHPHWQVIMGAISQKPDYAESDKTNNDDLWAWLMDSCAPALVVRVLLTMLFFKFLLCVKARLYWLLGVFVV